MNGTTQPQHTECPALLWNLIERHNIIDMKADGNAMRFVSATGNPDKLREIVAVLGDEIELLPRPEDLAEPEENAATLEGNARIKAVCVAEASGSPAIADDTGLEVDALNGEPGVRSARFAGEGSSYADNVALLLEQMQGVAASARAARFRTVALACWTDGSEVIAEGTVEGSIATSPRGENGFGYDPVFIPADSEGRTLAEMTTTQKNDISARGQAFRDLAKKLSEQPMQMGEVNDHKT